MKNFFRDVHLYLSLAAGLVIAVVCFTGAVLVFEKELQQTIYAERYHVKPQNQRASLDKMVALVQQKVPNAKVNNVKIYHDPTRSIEIGFAEEKSKNATEKPEKTALTGKEGKAEKGGKGGKGKGGKIAFVDPYTGQLLATSDSKLPFFRSMFELHRWLLVREPGKLIVGVSTVFFLFILLTGIILWWPKNAKIMKQRLKMKWDGGWKRLNHDLHIVVGFYTAVFLFVFAFTGLAWSFEWFNNAIYTVTGTQNEKPKPPVSEMLPGAQQLTFDAVYAAVQKQAPNAEFITINAPHEKAEAIAVTFMPQNALHERASTQLFFDQYSGNLLQTVAFQDKNLGQRVRATFYPVHVGSIGGLPGRIIAFISCIAGFTFPITGLILWLNRLKKEKKKQQKAKQKKVLA